MDPVAVYGAVVATLAAGWSIYREVTNRGHLKVEVALAGATIVIQVTNVGRAPAWLHSIGGHARKKGPFSLNDDRLPLKLEPGELFETNAMVSVFQGEDPPTFLAAWDTMSRRYKLPRGEFKELFRRCREL